MKEGMATDLTSGKKGHLSCNFDGTAFAEIAEKLGKLGKTPLVVCDLATFDDGLVYLKPRFDGIVRAKFVHFDPGTAVPATERSRLAALARAEGCDAVVGLGNQPTRELAREVAARTGLPYLLVAVTPSFLTDEGAAGRRHCWSGR